MRARLGAAAAAIAAVLAGGSGVGARLAQAQHVAPPPQFAAQGACHGAPVPLNDEYGPAEPVEMSQLAESGKTYHRRHVVTRGRLEILPSSQQYLLLTDAGSSVLLVPFEPSAYIDLAKMVGVAVEVDGISRTLVAKQGMVPCLCGTVPDSLCEDPRLPVLPDHQMDWPSISLTAKSVSERDPHTIRASAVPSLSDAGFAGAAAAGKSIGAVGQFRGANLCRDVAAPPRAAGDWVLLTSEGAVWVTGKRPEGRGFSLDPARRSDTTRWLAVKGKVETVGDAHYLRASSVELVPRPTDIDPAPCAP
jgi:hypothetical protein